MTSNIVITKSQVPIIQGTKLEMRNAQLLVSTGISSLDNFIGGGLAVGSTLLIEEDSYGTYSNVMLRYFIAEGVANSHSLLIASQDTKPSKILSELPALVENRASIKDNSSNSKNDMKIAWRYKNMKIMDISVEDSFAHYYDLSDKMDKVSLDKSKTVLWDGENIECENNIFNNKAYMDLLLNIEETISQGQHSITGTTKNKNILRIAINSLGSRSWLSDSKANTQEDLLKFTYMLKALLRQSFAVAIITVPILNFADYTTGIVQRLEHLSDTVIGLDSFAGSSKETNPLFKDYHGLLNIKKIPAFNTLINEDSQITDLAFKLRMRNFVIEIFHLPPEFDDSSQREQDEIASIGCGGTAINHKLDF